MKLSSKMERCGLSPMRKFNPYAAAAAERGIKIYHLNIGQPDIKTPDIFYKAISDFHDPVLSYAPSGGIPVLVDAVRGYYKHIGVELERRKKRAIEEKHRKESAAQMALEGLTYSEQVVVRDIFQQLRGESDLVVASKVADRAKVARSLVVSALRKLESAGMIEAHSYGPKGTWIKVLNDRFRDKIMAEDL